MCTHNEIKSVSQSKQFERGWGGGKTYTYISPTHARTHGPLPVVRALDGAARGEAPHVAAVPGPDVHAAEQHAREGREDLPGVGVWFRSVRFD